MVGGGTETIDNGAMDGRFEKYRNIRNEITAERTGGQWASKYGNKISDWDIAPPQEYFDELFRVSKNQIIWGGNYFDLPPTRCFVIWRKLTISDTFTMAMAEYAWTSFNSNAKVFEYAPQDKNRFHPTQKPVALYKWLLNTYANKFDLILDTHAGSGSCLVACQEMGFDYIGYEIDPVYYELSKERLDKAKAQVTIYDL